MVKANLLKENKERDYDKKDKDVPEEVLVVNKETNRKSSDCRTLGIFDTTKSTRIKY